MTFSALLKIFGGLGAVLALTVGAHAFLATNTVSSSSAGDGSGTISGFAISGIHYTLNSSNPTNLDSLTFTISPQPAGTTGTVDVKTPSTGTWITCSYSGTTVTCSGSGALSSVTVSSLNSLEVVAAD